MDRYSFRGKRVDNGAWITGGLVPPMGCVGTRYATPHIYFPSGPRAQVAPETIGQCTGLQDRNEKLIFEGDVCKDSLGWIFVVTWDEDNARFLGRHVKPRGGVYFNYVGKDPAVEIIGNRFDNPELLEG